MNLVSRNESYGRPNGDSERHARIVEAAQRAFVKLGFHAATMQNVAEEAGMSAGNLYRYFPSKEALVEGLCFHDHDERAENFLALASRTDVVEAFVTTLRENVFGAPREKAQLIVEIWAEASRNPRVAQISRDFDAATFEGLCMLLTEAKSKGAVAANVDVEFVARTMMNLVAGIFKRLAIEAEFEREREAGYAITVLRGLLNGALAPAASAAETI
jgi:TetR/AcrR family transcriptional regulator, repressor for uid operon